jgi:hypothetical protein
MIIGNTLEAVEGLNESLVLLTQKGLASCHVHLKPQYKGTQIRLPRK